MGGERGMIQAQVTTDSLQFDVSSEHRVSLLARARDMVLEVSCTDDGEFKVKIIRRRGMRARTLVDIDSKNFVESKGGRS